MITTVLLAYLAGFFAGNGLPYYHLGSTGRTNPTPFVQSATVNVTIGWVAFVIAATCWHYAHIPDHAVLGYAATGVGLLTVGLIHAATGATTPGRPGWLVFSTG